MCVSQYFVQGGTRSNEIGYLAKISKKKKTKVDGATWFFQTAYSKEQKEKNERKTKILNIKKPKLKDLENLAKN